jgi:glycolate oxidase
VKIHQLGQAWRGPVYSMEFLDQACLSHVKDDFKLEKKGDYLFFEIEQKFSADWLEEIQEKFPEYVDDIFQLSAEKYHNLRAAVPRAIFESNQKMQVEKMGTDIQVASPQFCDLLAEYHKAAEKLKIPSYLFGHFGDAHLHFNFLPSFSEREKCLAYFDDLYSWVAQVKASPFAEHGIGLLKQKYMKSN